MGGSIAIKLSPFAVVAIILLVLLTVATPLNIPQSDRGIGFMAITGFMFLAGVAMIAKGLNDLKLLRLVRDTPTSDIGSMASGDVEVKGTAKKMEDEFEAPFSGRRCLCYHYKVEEYVDQGKHSSWEEIASGSKRRPFALDDGTGAAAVDPSNADFEIEWDKVAATDGQEKPPERIQGFIRSSPNIDFEHDDFLWTGNRRRYWEKLLVPEDELYVFGEASTYSDSGVKKIQDGDAVIYMISDKSEEELVDGFSTWYKIYIPAGILAGIIGYAGLYASLL